MEFFSKREMKLFATLYPQKGRLLFSFERVCYTLKLLCSMPPVRNSHRSHIVSMLRFDHPETLLFLLVVPMQNHVRSEREFSQEITKHVACKGGKGSIKIKCR